MVCESGSARFSLPRGGKKDEADTPIALAKKETATASDGKK